MVDITKDWNIDQVLLAPGCVADIIAHYRRREQDLLEANNRYLERARAAEADAGRLRRLFDKQWRRTREADELWRKAHPGNDDVMPDLGELIRWLMDRTTVPTFRHKKRGSTYTLIGFGKMQAEHWRDPNLDAEYDNQAVDMREVAIYRSTQDGSLWVRPKEEFEDGRFESLSAADTPPPSSHVWGEAKAEDCVLSIGSQRVCGHGTLGCVNHHAPPQHVAGEPELTMLLLCKADAIRKEYQLVYGRPCDCSAPDGALHYGRAQGLEIAADIANALATPSPVPREAGTDTVES